MSTAIDRDALHRLIDALRPEDVQTAQRVLQALNASGDPLFTTLSNARDDDEEATASERESVDRARRNVQEGLTLSHDDVKRGLRRA